VHLIVEDVWGEKWVIWVGYQCAEVENWGFTEKHTVLAISANLIRLRDWETEFYDLLIKSDY